MTKDGGNPDSLLRLVTFSYLVGKTDMHAKNISFMRLDDGRVVLSPAYDIAMHPRHKGDNRRSALDINGKFLMNDITVGDVIAEGSAWGLPERRARNVVTKTAEDLAAALDNIDRDDHPGVPADAWDIVEDGVFRATDPVTRSIAVGAVESNEAPGGTEDVRGTATTAGQCRPTPARGAGLADPSEERR